MNILYSRTNSNRKAIYRIMTSVIEEKKRIYVRKECANGKSKKHLNIIENNHVAFKKYSKWLTPNIIHKSKNYLDFEFIEGTSAESLIEKLLLEKKYDDCLSYIKFVQQLLNDLKSETCNPYKQKLFYELFDPKKKYSVSKKIECIKPGLIDINFDNILISDKKKLYLIDIEWVYDLYVPKEFILLRSIFYLSANLQSVIQSRKDNDFECIKLPNGFLIPKKWLTVSRIDQNSIKKYLVYEENFQNVINISQNIFTLNKFFDPPKIEVDTSVETIDPTDKLMKELTELQKQNKELRSILDSIISSKFFKLWQSYNQVKKIIKRIISSEKETKS